MVKKPVKKAKVKVDEPHTEKDLQIVNIVVSSSLEHTIPLEKMAATLSNTEYNPEQFPGLVYKLIEAKATFLLFSNGKVVCTGTKSEAEANAALEKLIVILKKIGK